MHRYLKKHPRVFLPYRKEIEYFVDHSKYRELDRHLAYDYPDDLDAEAVGLSHVQLLYFEFAPERLHRHNPAARIIVSLRNPIDRAYSAYWHIRSLGRESSASFEEALEREPSIDPTNIQDRSHLSYLEHGHYAEQLERFRQYFPAKLMHVLLHEDMREHGYLGRLLVWLGINDPDFRPPEERYNAASTPRFPGLQRMLRSPDSPVNSTYKAVMPTRLRYFIHRHLVDRLSGANLRPFQYPPMDGQTRERLRAYFQPHNEQLAGMLGRDLSHWT